ncbi:MAG: DsbC family protein [Betaproteobacteria bacterium]|nr:MAG: DsbC family protein [Betaproteobacteria bacterium]
MRHTFIPRCLIVSAALMSTIAFSNDVARIQDAMRGIESMRRLPGSNMQLVQAAGNTFLMTENGRFAVVQGRLYDVWHNVEIKSVSDLDRVAAKLDLSRMKLDFNELATLTFGTGKRLVTAFIDPRCEHCATLLAQANSLTSEYQFRLVLLPLLGEQSVAEAKQLLCAPSGAVAALVAKRVASLPKPPNDCALAKLQKTIITARILGIESVPTVISPDGIVSRGVPESLSQFLKGSQP